MASTDFTFPTLLQIYAFVKVMWQGYRPEASFKRGTALWIMAWKLTKLIWREHVSIERAIRAWHPGTTYGKYLDWWLVWFRGSPGRYQAATSSVTDGLRVVYTGSPGACLNAILLDSTGLSYKITEELAGTGSPEDVSAISVATGYAVNLEAGDVLTFVSPPSGVTAEATLQADMDGGRDEETDDEGRIWLLKRVQDPVIGGHPTQIRSVIEASLPGLVRCYVYPKRQGYPMGFGTVDVAVLQVGEQNSSRIITAAQKTIIEAAAQASLPLDLWLDFRVLTVQEEDTGGSRVELTIQTEPDAPADKLVDWDVAAIATAPVVDSYAWATKTITADQDISSYGDARDLVTGDRVYVEGMATELVVALAGTDDGLATDATFTVTAWPWGDGSGPAGNMKIFSGGGLVTAIKTAVAEHVDTLGPEKGSAYYTLDTEWRDTLFMLRLRKAGIDVDSYMLDVVVDDVGGAGAADFPPTALTAATVNLVTTPASMVVVYQDLT